MQAEWIEMVALVFNVFKLFITKTGNLWQTLTIVGFSTKWSYVYALCCKK